MAILLNLVKERGIESDRPTTNATNNRPYFVHLRAIYFCPNCVFQTDARLETFQTATSYKLTPLYNMSPTELSNMILDLVTVATIIS